MPLQIPKIDDRRYQDLLDEALNRVPVHNPEWTNFNRSDPGVTLIEIFAFMTESLLYRANLIPERNRLKFLQLLGIPLNSATSARGIVTFLNERGLLTQEITLKADDEVYAGQVPFRLERGLDILPIEGRVYFKRPLKKQETEVEDYYRELYASFKDAPLDDNVDFKLYETALLDGKGEKGISLADDTIDNSIWIALLARENQSADDARESIAGKTLNLGIVPALDEVSMVLEPGGQKANAEASSWLSYKIPKMPNEEWKLPTDLDSRKPEYRPLEARTTTDVSTEPGVVEIPLPGNKDELSFWSNLEPLELGADDFPPNLEDTKINERLITWLRITTTAIKFRFLWIGINASTVTQRTRVTNEVLSDGTGEPDQVVKLSRGSIVPNSVQLFVTAGNVTEEWKEIDDLLAAGAEVSAPDLRQPPGSKPGKPKSAKVFRVNAESGEIYFGDGANGQRPPSGAKISVSYDYGAGKDGNVGAGAINTSPILPAGVKVSNPVRAWGGDDSETVLDGEKQISRYLKHRERLVTVADFELNVIRTPGVSIGRVEIIPTFNPEFSPNEPGDAPGAVTVMVIPRYDSRQPDAPVPDRLFLDTICRYLDERRLVTTEIFLRGPVYKAIWISIGINIVAEKSVAEVREAVKQALLDFLAPINAANAGLFNEEGIEINKGWRLRKPVAAKEILAVASRVDGVMFVNDVLLTEGSSSSIEQFTMNGLELPRVMGISVSIGDALPLAQLLGTTTDEGSETGETPPPRRIVPIPVVPEEC